MTAEKSSNKKNLGNVRVCVCVRVRARENLQPGRVGCPLLSLVFSFFLLAAVSLFRSSVQWLVTITEAANVNVMVIE